MSGVEKVAKLARALAVISLVLVACASLLPDLRPSEVQRLPVVITLGHVMMHFAVTACWYRNLTSGNSACAGAARLCQGMLGRGGPS